MLVSIDRLSEKPRSRARGDKGGCRVLPLDALPV